MSNTLPTPPEPLHLFILTGASRGIGLAMAGQLLQADHKLLCISRRIHPLLDHQAAAARCRLQQWSQDLAHDSQAAEHLAQWLAQQDGSRFASACLINNAAQLPPALPLREASATDLSACLRVGLEAPVLLTAAFLRATMNWPVTRKVLNISSGLGQRAMASQASYCAAKAGLDHFTRCLALEEARYPNGARVCALAPGVVDTDMQLQLRSASVEQFPDQPGFAALKSGQQLVSPEVAARQILAWLAHPDFGSVPVADVRNLPN